MTAQGSLDGLASGLRQGRDLRDWLNRESGNAQELAGFEKLELEPSASKPFEVEVAHSVLSGNWTWDRESPNGTNA